MKALIRRLAGENDWRARKIHAELEKLEFTVCLATVSRYLIFDNDRIFADEVSKSIKALGITPKRTVF